MDNFEGPSYSDFINRGSNQLMPVFSTRAVQNNFLSEKEGRPIYEDREWVEIFIPGDKNTTVSRELREDDKRRWPDHYKAFLEGREAPVNGTLLSECTIISASMAKELEHFKVRTVEQLAEMPDSLLKNLGMGATKLRDQAREWLDKAKGSAATNSTVKKVKDLEEQNRLKDETIQSLEKRLAVLEAKK